jgi:rubrerythrin
MPYQIQSPNFKLRQNQWDIDQVLPIDRCLTPQDISNIPAPIVDNFCKLLERDVFSEADATVLYHYLMQRRSLLSSGFIVMLDFWLADERKHYEALRRVYHQLSGMSFAQMDRAFADRVHEFEPIARVLVDEFTILVTMMFDEIGTVYSYRRDLMEYYRYFGPDFEKVGHYLIKDEGMHFNNAATLVLHYYADRLGEVELLLQEISALEHNLGTYYKSFFLDHAQEQFRFPPQFNDVIIQVILARLGLATYPDRWELQQLWQWQPPEWDCSAQLRCRTVGRA